MSKSYSATLITKGVNGEVMSGSGSFANINIDGRLSHERAVDIARYTFTRECVLRSQPYLGFAIELTERFVEYKTPSIIDSTYTVKDIAYLL